MTDEALHGTSLLASFPSDWNPQVPFAQQSILMAHFRGALATLFGDPQLGDGETQFDYCIEADDPTGATWVFHVYEGSRGATIGSRIHDAGARQAAWALMDLIARTHPTDFQATYYADEYDSTVTYGCQNGRCFYHEVRGDHTESLDDAT